MATCWICSKKFSNKTELNIHLTSKEHRRMTVVCVWCKEEKTFTRPSDLYHHCTQKHLIETNTFQKSFFSTKNCFFFAIYPADYSRISNIEPWTSSNAVEARRLVMKWVDRQAGSSVKRDNWRRGWKAAIKLEETGKEMFYATKVSAEDLVNLNINTKIESKTCEREVVEKGAVGKMVGEDNISLNQDEQGKQSRVTDEKEVKTKNDRKENIEADKKKVETKSDRKEKENREKSENKCETKGERKENENREKSENKVETKNDRKESIESDKKKVETKSDRKEKENREKSENKCETKGERKEKENREKSENKVETKNDRKESIESDKKKVETKSDRKEKENREKSENKCETKGERKEKENREKSENKVETKNFRKENIDSGAKKVESKSDRIERTTSGINENVTESKSDREEVENSELNENRVDMQSERKEKDEVNEKIEETKRGRKEKQRVLSEMKVEKKGDREESIENSVNKVGINRDRREKNVLNEKGDAVNEQQADKVNGKDIAGNIKLETNKEETIETTTIKEHNDSITLNKDKYGMLIKTFSEELKYNPEMRTASNEDMQIQKNSGTDTPLYDETRDIEGELTIVSSMLGSDRKRKREEERESKHSKDRIIKIMRDDDGIARRVITRNTEHTKEDQRNIKDINNNETSVINAENKYEERAKDLLITGVMPLCPPGRRNWDTPNMYNLFLKGLTFSWPPPNWKEMTPDRKLLAWEFAAMRLEEMLESEISPSLSRGYLLDKYNFLALPDTSKHRKEPEETAGSRARFYTYQMLREIADGRKPTKAEEIHIQCLEKNRNFSDDFILKIRGIQAPLRLNL